MDLTIGVAFVGGLASFLSPCVFSLVPAYIGYLSGRSMASDGSETVKISRWETFGHGLAFVFGFSLVFITLGAAASAIGSLLADLSYYIARIGGAVVIVFGLHMTGIIRIPFLAYELKPQNNLDRGRSFFSSALIGIFFSAGWTPCTGPVLASIYTLAVEQHSLAVGVKMLAAYSTGLAIPFLAAALGLGWVTFLLRRFRKLTHYVEVTMGVILIILGFMLLLGNLAVLARFFKFLPNLG
jgi:cytochrome c-type biogenesis protein